MSEPTTTTIDAAEDDPATGDQSTQDTAAIAEESGAEAGESSNREAARYRTRLRDAEAERDTLRGQVDAMQRAEAERLAADHLTKPDALWKAGVNLSNVLAEDGTVDPAKVQAAAEGAVAELGLETPRSHLLRSNVVRGEGGNPGGGHTNDWTEAFRV